MGRSVRHTGPLEASRQIRGIPHSIDTRIYADAESMVKHLESWLTSHRTKILIGPRRRVDRELAYLKLMAQLKVAWNATRNRTAVAGQLGLHPSAIESLIKSPARIALTPWWTICELATQLGVNLEARRALTSPESRAWAKAAENGTWGQNAAERLRTYAVTIAAEDLELPGTWTALYASMLGTDRPD